MKKMQALSKQLLDNAVKIINFVKTRPLEGTQNTV